MGCQARLTLVAEQVCKALRRLSDPAAGVTVARAYAPDWLAPDYWRDNPTLQASFTGRRVYVFSARERHEGPFTRAEDINLYTVGVMVLELYTGTDPEPPLDWVDERVGWVEANVYDRIGDARADPPIVEDADPMVQEWVKVYDPDALRQLKLFWSEIHVTYRKIEDVL
jgi:hypothetical protein